MQTNLPNLIVIGAQKAGTSSLHYYLNQHPDIHMSAKKETQFFHEEHNWSRGIDWYKSLFSGQAKIYGESCTSYSFKPLYKNVAEKMHRLIPNAKLIYLVRDPIERAISGYIYSYKGYTEHRSHYQCLSNPEDIYYRAPSRYYYQLQEYLKYFDPKQIMIVSTEKLRYHREETLKAIFEFLGVDPSFTSEEFSRQLNTHKQRLRRKKPRRWIRYLLNNDMENFPFKNMLSQKTKNNIRHFLLPKGEVVKKPNIPDMLRKKMVNFFKPDVEMLKEYTGYDFKEWNNFSTDKLL